MIFKNKVLITGATGFLGRHITQFFDSKSINYIKLGRSDRNDLILDLAQNIPKFKEKYSSVIHCAGLAHVYPKSEEDRNNFFSSHVTATEKLLKGLTSNLCDRFIFISTVAVYGRDTGVAFDENVVPTPSTVYGQCKYEAENIALAWGKKTNVPVYILRLPLIVGDNPPGNLGQMIRAIQKKYYVRIKNINPRKSMVLAKDIAEFLSLDNLGEPGIYNLTDGYDPTLREVENYIYKKYNVRLKPITLPFFIIKWVARIGDFIPNLPVNSLKLKKMTSDLTFNGQKARSKLNWDPKKIIDF